MEETILSEENYMIETYGVGVEHPTEEDIEAELERLEDEQN